MSAKPTPLPHARAAERFLSDAERAGWHDETLWQVRTRRDHAASRVAEWEELRALAAAIKAHTLGALPEYIERFADNAERLGAKVHFALDAAEHNRIVLELLSARGITRVVKSKSMLTEECGLNPWLERHGIEVLDTDLGELIVQLRREPPSHIVMPAIHLRRAEVAALFAERLGSGADADPKALTEVARGHLRQAFFGARAGITGVNFAVAETGGIVVCTNEGNADLGTSLPEIHIACMGIEKLVPRLADLGVFLRLLARSATGQAITAYTSHFHGPRPGAELHIVLVDNGRSQIRARAQHVAALSCIRCGACMNTCPVYRRSGGHSYGTHVPGPIGSILAPLSYGERYASLPFACTLCGSCRHVCPVKIDLPAQLLELRGGAPSGRSKDDGARSDDGGALAREQNGVRSERERRPAAALRGLLLGLVAWVLASATRTGVVGAVARALARRFPRLVTRGPLGAWARTRELPVVPAQSFRAAYRRRAASRRRAP